MLLLLLLWILKIFFFRWNKCALRILLDDLWDLQCDSVSGSGRWRKKRRMILSSYLENRLRLNVELLLCKLFFFVSKKLLQFQYHKTPLELRCTHETDSDTAKRMLLKNVSRLTPQRHMKHRRRRETNLNKEPEKWLMFLSLLFASPSRLICLSRQTHQQLFFSGWSSIKHITQTHISVRANETRREKSREIHWKRRNQLKIINYLAPILSFQDRKRTETFLIPHGTCHCSTIFSCFVFVATNKNFLSMPVNKFDF